MKPDKVKTRVFIGKRESKTNFAFSQSLLNAEHGHVLFISKSEIHELPKNVDISIPPDKNILRMLMFTYPSNWNELISECCMLHTWKTTPCTILVHGLDEYLNFQDEDNVSKGALLCTALLSASDACSNILGDICKLIICVDRSKYDEHRNVLQTLINTYFYGDITFE